MANEPIGITMRGGADEVGVTLDPTAASDTIGFGPRAETGGTVTMPTLGGLPKASTLGGIMVSGITTTPDTGRWIDAAPANGLPDISTCPG
jgi:hypothetical protein